MDCFEVHNGLCRYGALKKETCGDTFISVDPAALNFWDADAKYRFLCVQQRK